LYDIIDGNGISSPTVTNGVIPSSLESLISNFKLGLENDLEKSFSVNLIDKFEAVVAAAGLSDLRVKMQLGLLSLISYINDRILGTRADLTNYNLGIVGVEYEQLISTFYSKMVEFEEASPTESFDKMSEIKESFATDFIEKNNSARYRIIQEMVSVAESMQQVVYTEFWSGHQSIYNPEPSAFNFAHESTVGVLPTQFALLHGIESNPKYTESLGEVAADILYQSWTDVPQFDFEKSLPALEHFYKNNVNLQYINYIFSDPNRVDLLEQADINLPLGNAILEHSTLTVPLLPLSKAFTSIAVPFVPLKDLPLLHLIPFTPLLNSPLEILMPLGVMLNIVPELLIPFEPDLFQDIIWKMEDSIPEVGAVSTYIHYWADQGQFNDKWNLREFNSNAYIRVYTPMVMYTKDYVYGPGGFADDGKAEDEKVKYYNAGIIQIPGTDFWNYRIYFKDRHFCVPRKGQIFPVTWYIRGG
jgi:hypothetical protein